MFMCIIIFLSNEELCKQLLNYEIVLHDLAVKMMANGICREFAKPGIFSILTSYSKLLIDNSRKWLPMRSFLNSLSTKVTNSSKWIKFIGRNVDSSKFLDTQDWTLIIQSYFNCFQAIRYVNTKIIYFLSTWNCMK